MKLSKFIFVFMMTLLLVACSNPDAMDSKGRAIYLSDYEGKWLYVNYWATWCKPCVAELPALDAFYKNNAKNVVVLGVSFDKLSNPDIEAFAQTVKVDFPLLSELPKQKLSLSTPKTLPTTYVINPQGELVETLHGPQTLASLQASLSNISTGGVV